MQQYAEILEILIEKKKYTCVDASASCSLGS